MIFIPPPPLTLIVKLWLNSCRCVFLCMACGDMKKKRPVRISDIDFKLQWTKRLKGVLRHGFNLISIHCICSVCVITTDKSRHVSPGPKSCILANSLIMPVLGQLLRRFMYKHFTAALAVNHWIKLPRNSFSKTTFSHLFYCYFTKSRSLSFLRYSHIFYTFSAQNSTSALWLSF